MTNSQELESEKSEYIDVQDTTKEYRFKSGLQSKFRADGILEYYVIPGTKKILYKRKDIEAFLESGRVASKGAEVI
ncbi:hypothetical protein [Sulfurimonas sp. NW9]|uniref:hypothetical protein n=1 Tax=Sulfurimonas sp. NW9 TaxID=2922728 RepID=UPI003DA8BC60